MKHHQMGNLNKITFDIIIEEKNFITYFESSNKTSIILWEKVVIS